MLTAAWMALGRESRLGEEETTLDFAQHDVVEDAGRRSRTKCGSEDPGRRAGPKIPDEAREGIRAGTAGNAMGFQPNCLGINQGPS